MGIIAPSLCRSVHNDGYHESGIQVHESIPFPFPRIFIADAQMRVRMRINEL